MPEKTGDGFGRPRRWRAEGRRGEGATERDSKDPRHPGGRGMLRPHSEAENWRKEQIEAPDTSRVRLQRNVQVGLFSLELSLRHVMVRTESCLSCTVCHVLVSFITTKVDIRSHILQIKKERERTQTLKFPTFTQLMGAKTRIWIQFCLILTSAWFSIFCFLLHFSSLFLEGQLSLIVYIGVYNNSQPEKRSFRSFTSLLARVKGKIVRIFHVFHAQRLLTEFCQGSGEQTEQTGCSFLSSVFRL